MGIETNQTKLTTEQTAEETSFSGSTKKTYRKDIIKDSQYNRNTADSDLKERHPKILYDFARNEKWLGPWRSNW